MGRHKQKFHFTTQTIGLPDTCILNEHGKPDILVLSKILRLNNRRERNHTEKCFSKLASSFQIGSLKNGSLLDYYLNQEFRRKLFLSICQAHQKNKGTKVLYNSSLECFVFNEIDDDFFSATNKPEKYDEFKELVDSNYLQDPFMSERVLIPMLNLWDKIEERLVKENEDLLAVAVIGAATILGPKFYERAVALCPTLQDNYQYIISLAENYQKQYPSTSKPSTSAGAKMWEGQKIPASQMHILMTSATA